MKKYRYLLVPILLLGACTDTEANVTELHQIEVKEFIAGDSVPADNYTIYEDALLEEVQRIFSEIEWEENVKVSMSRMEDMQMVFYDRMIERAEIEPVGYKIWFGDGGAEFIGEWEKESYGQLEQEVADDLKSLLEEVRSVKVEPIVAMDLNEKEKAIMAEVVATAKELAGIANVMRPHYKFSLGDSLYFLWLGEQDASLMNVEDTNVLYQIEPGYIDDLHVIAANGKAPEAQVFQSGGYTMLGIENKVGFLYEEEMLELKEDQEQKYMFHFWGSPEELEGEFKVTGIPMDVAESITMAESPSLGDPLNGADAHIPASLKFPESGQWKLEVLLGDRLFSQFLVDVKE